MRIINKLTYEKNVFKMHVNYDGPQKQLVYCLRFPVAYKNAQLVSQRVDFTSYFDWMGQVREYSLRPIMDRIIKLAKNGKWGLATNAVRFNALDLLKANDILEVRLWLDRITGHDNIYHLSFDWLRFLQNQSYERVASSSLIVTCVKILGHGEAMLTRPPGFLKNFFDAMRPQTIQKSPIASYNSLFSEVNLSEKIKDCSDNPKYIFENKYQTSLENSNLIGNIYFSNYCKWINSTKDLFFYRNENNLFDKTKFKYEFITLNFRISHLKEAMPFDQILVKMYLNQLYKKGVIFKYDAFKKKGSSDLIKLATATQTVGFVRYNSFRPILTTIPPNLLKILNS